MQVYNKKRKGNKVVDWKIGISSLVYERSVQESDKSRKKVFLNLVLRAFRGYYLVHEGRREND